MVPVESEHFFSNDGKSQVVGRVFQVIEVSMKHSSFLLHLKFWRTYFYFFKHLEQKNGSFFPPFTFINMSRFAVLLDGVMVVVTAFEKNI